MSCKIKRFKKLNKIDELLSNYEKIKQSQKHKLNESFLLNNKISYYKNINESILFNPFREHNTICLMNNHKHILFESSVYNQPTQPSIIPINKIIEEYNLTEDNISVYYFMDDLEIADMICFFLPISVNKVEDIINNIEKIMTVCGYYQAALPERNSEEYILQYAPNNPEWINIKLPDKLHHYTTVENALKISEEGFIPGYNDIFNYNKPRIYFAASTDQHLLWHIIRKYRKLLLKSDNKTIEYADIIINTPPNIKFFGDIRMKNLDSFYTFDKIDKKYIDSINIKEVKTMNFI